MSRPCVQGRRFVRGTSRELYMHLSEAACVSHLCFTMWDCEYAIRCVLRVGLQTSSCFDIDIEPRDILCCNGLMDDCCPCCRCCCCCGSFDVDEEAPPTFGSVALLASDVSEG